MNMKIKLFLAFWSASIILLLYQGIITVQGSANRSNISPIEVIPNFPEILNVGTTLDCGDYKIQILGQPVVTKSSNSIIADLDLKYLIVRIGITNTSDQTKKWLTPNTFTAQETYLNHAYGIYRLDYIMSAKASSGFNLPAFFSSIESGKMLSTILVFEVFPEAENWIITFSPSTFTGETSFENVKFLLPKALKQ